MTINNKFYKKHRKINILNNSKIRQSVRLEQQSDRNNDHVELIKISNPIDDIFKQDADFSVDWSPMDQEYTGDDETDVDPNTAYKEWEILFERIYINLLPFIKTYVLVRVGSGEIDDEAIIESYVVYKFFEVEDIEGTENYKRVKVKIITRFSDGDIWQPYEAKLVFKFVNPQKDY